MHTRCRHWLTGTIALVAMNATGWTSDAVAVEPPLEQYITLDDGRYALQADGTYSKVGGNAPPAPKPTHNHVHNHPNGQTTPTGSKQNEQYIRLDDGLYALQSDGTYSKVDRPQPQPQPHNRVLPQGNGTRPSPAPQANEKYLRLADGVYVLQSDGTYAKQSITPVPQGNVTPNYLGPDVQPWQNGGRIPPQRQPSRWVEEDEGTRWMRQNDNTYPQPQRRPNDYRPQPNWVDNNVPQRLPPNRQPNRQDDSDLQRTQQEAWATDGRTPEQRRADELRKLGREIRQLIDQGGR